MPSRSRFWSWWYKLGLGGTCQVCHEWLTEAPEKLVAIAAIESPRYRKIVSSRTRATSTRASWCWGGHGARPGWTRWTRAGGARPRNRGAVVPITPGLTQPKPKTQPDPKGNPEPVSPPIPTPDQQREWNKRCQEFYVRCREFVEGDAEWRVYGESQCRSCFILCQRSGEWPAEANEKPCPGG
jgi:hypothetical protein